MILPAFAFFSICDLLVSDLKIDFHAWWLMKFMATSLFIGLD